MENNILHGKVIVYMKTRIICMKNVLCMKKYFAGATGFFMRLFNESMDLCMKKWIFALEKLIFGMKKTCVLYEKWIFV